MFMYLALYLSQCLYFVSENQSFGLLCDALVKYKKIDTSWGSFSFYESNKIDYDP